MYAVPSLVAFTRRCFITNITMAAVAATSNTPSTDTAIIIHGDKDEDEFPLHLFLSSGGIECGSTESKEAIKEKNAKKRCIERTYQRLIQ